MYIDLPVKYSLFLSDFNETWICLTDFRKKKITRVSYIMKIRPVGADRWTDRQDEASSRSSYKRNLIVQT